MHPRVSKSSLSKVILKTMMTWKISLQMKMQDLKSKLWLVVYVWVWFADVFGLDGCTLYCIFILCFSLLVPLSMTFCTLLFGFNIYFPIKLILLFEMHIFFFFFCYCRILCLGIYIIIFQLHV